MLVEGRIQDSFKICSTSLAGIDAVSRNELSDGLNVRFGAVAGIPCRQTRVK